MFTVRVVYKSDGKPAKNKKVSIAVDGLFSGISREEWTDENGVARIDLGNKEYVQGRIYVNGSVKHEGYIEKFSSVAIDG